MKKCHEIVVVTLLHIYRRFGVVGTDVSSRFMLMWSAYAHMAPLVEYRWHHNLIKL